jgi:endonuclease/exonuclease/phosphatase family metal-dependent hydrolase
MVLRHQTLLHTAHSAHTADSNDADHAAQRSLRLVTYNIHKGVQGLGPICRLEIHNLRQAIEKLDADIVCLQEVRHFNTQQAKRFKNWPQSSQSEFLAPQGYYSAYKTNAVTKHGEHGNALLSKWPILTNQHADISDHRFEQRGLLHVVIDYEGAPLHVVVLHLGLFARSRKRQIAKLGQFIEREIAGDESLIVAGDFNDWNSALAPMLFQMGLSLSAAQGPSQKRENKIPTFPSRLPLLQLDYVYTRGLSCGQCYTPIGRHWAQFSDHLPLIVDFEK